MPRNTASFLLALALMLNLSCFPCNAQTQERRQDRAVERIKSNVAKLGTGAQARVRVTLRDGKKLNGYISEVGTDSFVIKDSKTQARETIMYGEVSDLQRNKS